jgi:hypothetical protein
LNKYFNTLVAALIVFICWRETALGQESALQSAPIKGDAENLELPSTQAFTQEKEPEPGPWSLKESLKDSPAFFRDMTSKLNLRNFYYNQSDATDTPGHDKEKVTWAQGENLQVKSGKVSDVFSIGGEVFTNQKLYGPEDKDGAKLLEPGQDTYTVIGVANPRFDYEGHVVSLYRQRMDLPYVNSQDNRLTPNTFENYAYAYLGEGDAPPFQFGMGYFNKMKKRDSDEFVYMSEAAGITGHDSGMPWIGARVRPAKDLKIVAVDYDALDILNIFYSDAEYSMKLSEDWGLKSSVQFSAQNSVGDDLLTGEDVSGTTWGFQQAASYRKFMVRAAVTTNDKGMTLQSPFGSYPGYNSSIVEDFNRAGETAWKIGISYDFVNLGLDGLSFYSDYIAGDGAVDDSGNSLNDKEEKDFNIDYRVKEGLLTNFWLRLRAASIHEDTVGTTEDYRVIVNYDVPIL